MFKKSYLIGKNQTQSTIIIGIEFNKIQGEVEAGDTTENLKVYFFV